jgi:biopolymer transport protein ExbD
MKLMTYRLLMAVFAAGLGTGVLAVEKPELARVALCSPGKNVNPPGPEKYVMLVIEGPTLSYDANPIPAAEVVDYVNQLLATRNVSEIGVYAREGTTYGDVVRAIDTLRETNAKNIGISMKELAVGREL